MSIVAQFGVGQEGYKTAADVRELNDRLEVRYELRMVLKRVSDDKRCRRCGKPLIASDVVIRVKEGSAFYGGVLYCGKVWLCPVCSPKIRFRRADEVSRAVLRSLEVGNANLFVTRTMPHRSADSLRVLLADLKECKRYVRNQKDIKAFYQQFGFVGDVTATEITYGLRGWHPHMHAVELFAFDVSLDALDALHKMYWRHARRFYDDLGYSKLSAAVGVHIEKVQEGGNALGRYLSKLQEGGSLGNEMTRADLKKGRAGSMMPFELLADFANTGDMDTLALWHEYETATRGRSSVRFSPGLRAVLLPGEKEKTDEELANEDVGASDEVRFAQWFYDEICKRRLDGRVLAAYNRGGFDALVQLLLEYNLAHGGGYYQINEGSS